MRYKTIIAIVAVGLSFAMATTPASAILRSQARAHAKLDQAENCFYYGSEFWKCREPFYAPTSCMLSVMNSGRGQYLCVGRFLQVFHQPIFFPGFRRMEGNLVHRLCLNRMRYDVRNRRITRLIHCELVSIA